jgi:hypothetical protein
MTRAPSSEPCGGDRRVLRDRVCVLCLDSRDEGECGLAPGRECPLDRQAVAVGRTIRTTPGGRLEDVVVALEGAVCGQCQDGPSSTSCEHRRRGECALWLYLPLVVAALRRSEGAPTTARAPRAGVADPAA